LLDIWDTPCLHIFSAVEDIVEWYKGSGMRPYLEALDSEPERQRFMAEYLNAIRPLYQPRPDGHVLFPFRRLFMIAYRDASCFRRDLPDRPRVVLFPELN